MNSNDLFAPRQIIDLDDLVVWIKRLEIRSRELNTINHLLQQVQEEEPLRSLTQTYTTGGPIVDRLRSVLNVLVNALQDARDNGNGK